jgi:hypothetical protein
VELEDIARIIRGVIFALGFGHFFVEGFYRWLLRSYQTHDPKAARKPEPIPGALTGFVERSLFTLIVALEFEGAVTAMMAWIAAKMLANWSRTGPTNESKEDRDARILGAFVALLASAVSMIFALVGGLIAAGKIWPS